MVLAAKPINPASKMLADTMAAAPVAETVEEMRANMDMMTKSAPQTPSVSAVDLKIPTRSVAVPCRLYKPPGSTTGPSPVVIYIHGGGHTQGSVDGYDNFCRALCLACGAAVLSVGYRLGPENPFPAAVDDSYSAVRWVLDGKGKSHGIDGSRVAISGDSAGGNLTIVMCLMARNDGVSGSVRFALPLVPATDYRPSAREEATEKSSYMAYGKGLVLTKDMITFFTNSYLGSYTDITDWRLSPILADLSRLPKMTVVTAGYDPLRDEGEAFVRRAKAAGSPVQHLCYEDEVHVWFLLGGFLPHAAEAINHFGKMLREGLGLAPPSRL